MNRLVILPVIAATVAAITSPAWSAPVTYTLDPTHTNVVWSADHFGFSSPSGKFADVKGTLVLDDEKPADSKLDVTIQTGSVVTGIPKFDEHLKSADFFNSEKFPTATFVSTKVEPTGKDTAKVEGNLTLLGVTKPVTLEVKLNKMGEHPFNKKSTVGFSASTLIYRSYFGIKYALPGVSDEVKIAIETEANKAD